MPLAHTWGNRCLIRLSTPACISTMSWLTSPISVSVSSCQGTGYLPPVTHHWVNSVYSHSSDSWLSHSKIKHGFCLCRGSPVTSSHIRVPPVEGLGSMTNQHAPVDPTPQSLFPQCPRLFPPCQQAVEWSGWLAAWGYSFGVGVQKDIT